MRRPLALTGFAITALVIACAPSFSCPDGKSCVQPGLPCKYIEGYDECSLVPVRRTCECDGRIAPVAPNYNQSACSYIFSWCEGKIVAYHEWHSFADAPP